MPSLHELQGTFSRALVAGDVAAIADRIACDAGLDAASRIAIYRSNVLGNCRAALRDVYPAVLAVVGERFFQAATGEYMASHPSLCGDLHEYGEAFGDFLASWPQAQQLVYLRDLARLEWAMHRVFHAADAGALDLGALAEVGDDALESLRFKLHPASRLVASPYPILRIWEISQPSFSGDQTVDLNAGEDRLLVIRRSRVVEMERLSAGEFVWLDALASQRPLEEAHAAATRIEPQFDLAACLQRHVLSRTLVSFTYHRGKQQP